MSGAFVAVIGPSGAGKDSVLAEARRLLSDTPGVEFLRRTVTRPSSADEEHDSLGPAEFARAERAGEFALTWRAHGLSYGIPARVQAAVADGAVIVANVSRTTLDALGATFPSVRVVRVTASEEVRLQRILARGRESAEAALARVARPDPDPGFPVDLELSNDGPLANAVAEFTEYLTRLAARDPRLV